MTTSTITRPGFWATEFPARTSGKTTPFLFKRLVSGLIDVPDALGGIRALHDARAAGIPSAARARVYLGEERRDDLADVVMKAPAWPEDASFVPGIQALVGGERFSLIINNFETTSERLSAGLGKLLGEIYQNWGVPAGGAEQAAFIGNYSGTAFGVHEGYEDAFLCHLGPGTKDFYCWPAKEYERLTGGTEALTGDYDWLLEHGTLFVLEPGDALFLPARVFHVGVQNEFSVSVAIPLYTYPDARLLRYGLLPELLDDVIGDGLPAPSPMQDLAEGWQPARDRILPLMQDALAKIRDRTGDLLSSWLDRRWATILSNGGWEKVEPDLARVHAAGSSTALIAPGARARLRPPYRIMTGNGPELYLRGCEITAAATVLAGGLLEELTSGGTITIPQAPEALEALRALAGTGGLIITPGTTSEEGL
jgi:hypothetical protein